MAKRKRSAADRAAAALRDVLEERDEARSTATALDQILAGTAPSLVTMPELATAGPSATGATTVTAGGVGGSPDVGEGPGFLATFWPLLLGLGAGLLAFFFFGWSWWASALAGVAALVLGRMGAAFMHGAAAAGEG